jgi:hypothetical protein
LNRNLKQIEEIEIEIKVLPLLLDLDFCDEKSESRFVYKREEEERCLRLLRLFNSEGE